MTKKNSILKRSSKNQKIVEEEDLVEEKLRGQKQRMIEEIQSQSDSAIPIKAQMLLSPIRQFTLYRSIPFTLIFHLLVITIDIIFLFQEAKPDWNNAVPTKQTLYKIFLDTEHDPD